jgi:membrane fusion protein (multidrug efflux system)
VTSGIDQGDKIIIQGSSKAKPGLQVHAVPASDNAAVIDASPNGPGGKGGKSGKSGAGGASGASQ